MPGKVYIVGAGPGDPELITIKGLNAIKKADVILYDRLIPKKLLEYAKANCELIYVGKERGKHTYTQEKINNLLLEKAKENKIVVRLKGGDPYIFGRGEEECRFLKHKGIDCEVIPGISSLIAAPIFSGIPLTNRELSSSFAVVTGQEALNKKEKKVKIAKIASCVDTLVIFMGVKNFSKIIKELKNAVDDSTPMAIIMNASTDKQKTIITSLSEANKIIKKLSPPAIIIIGNVIKLRNELWHLD